MRDGMGRAASLRGWRGVTPAHPAAAPTTPRAARAREGDVRSSGDDPLLRRPGRARVLVDRRRAAACTSHSLAVDGRVWLVDPVRHEPALELARGLGQPAAVLQLLDRHNRDRAAVAAELQVPHLVVPSTVPNSPFETIPVKHTRRWNEVALWWRAERTLVVAEAVGTNRFFRSGDDAVGVHLVLRLSPPREALASWEPEHLLVGHGEGIHGPSAAKALRHALDDARRRAAVDGAPAARPRVRRGAPTRTKPLTRPTLAGEAPGPLIGPSRRAPPVGATGRDAAALPRAPEG